MPNHNNNKEKSKNIKETDQHENKEDEILKIIEKISNKKITEIMTSITMMSDKYDEVIIELKKLREENAEIKKENGVLLRENEKLKKDMSELNDRLTEVETKKIAKELEIVGVPEEPQEKLELIFENVLKNIKMEKKEINIKSISRAKYGKKGCRNIIIKLQNKEQRDLILKNGKSNKKSLTLNNVNFSQNNPYYINECLPKAKKDLLKDVKTLKNKLEIKYIWVSNGDIKIRKHEKDKVKVIKSLKDLEKI